MKRNAKIANNTNFEQFWKLTLFLISEVDLRMVIDRKLNANCRNICQQFFFKEIKSYLKRKTLNILRTFFSYFIPHTFTLFVTSYNVYLTHTCKQINLLLLTKKKHSQK